MSTGGSDIPVLIDGAGPTGLVLALWLAKAGIRFRLIDKASSAGTTSRALGVHARTLEFYRQLGISHEVNDLGFAFPGVNLWSNRLIKAHFELGPIGRELTPFPYVLIFPQDEHEELLIRHLAELGIEVERETELLSFTTDAAGVSARLKMRSGEFQTVRADFLAGCDGAHSRVRELLKTDFEGSTYADLYYVADISGAGPALNGELHVALDEAEFLAVFPLKGRGHARLIGVLRHHEQGKAVTWLDVSPKIFRALALEVSEVQWFSTYRVHHRVAARFQTGRVFLLGDAAHIHSPVGAQGMNTGIGDAVNLAWKLAEVIKGLSSDDILRTYQIERRAFARRLVRTTDFAFEFISSPGPWARVIRTRVIPVILPLALSFTFTKRLLFRTVSQTGISYRKSPMSRGQKRRLHGGDRLPWLASVDNFAPLRSRDWQVHVYGPLEIDSAEISVPVHRFPWNDEMRKKRFSRKALYLVRPDGHIALVAKSSEAIRRYLAAKS